MRECETTSSVDRQVGNRGRTAAEKLCLHATLHEQRLESMGLTFTVELLNRATICANTIAKLFVSNRGRATRREYVHVSQSD